MASNPSRAPRARQRVSPCIAKSVVRTKRWIEVDGVFAIGEGGGELLEAVDRHGSLAAAARHVGWSYRHAWGYVRRAEGVLGASLIVRQPGRGAANGSVLTPDARLVVAEVLPRPRAELAQVRFRSASS